MEFKPNQPTNQPTSKPSTNHCASIQLVSPEEGTKVRTWFLKLVKETKANIVVAMRGMAKRTSKPKARKPILGGNKQTTRPMVQWWPNGHWGFFSNILLSVWLVRFSFFWKLILSDTHLLVSEMLRKWSSAVPGMVDFSSYWEAGRTKKTTLGLGQKVKFAPFPRLMHEEEWLLEVAKRT